MNTDDLSSLAPPLGQTSVAVPIAAGSESSPLRLCVVVRLEPDALGNSLVVLRDGYDAQVFLGCVIDAADHVQRWLEIWVQDPRGPARRNGLAASRMNNVQADEQWQQRVDRLDASGVGHIVYTGWEKEHPLPTYIDLVKKQPVHPQHESGHPWSLCRDDALLTAKGLPPYSASNERFLYAERLGQESPFVPVSGETADREPVAGRQLNVGGLIPFNPAGGLMMVRDYSPLSYRTYADWLGRRVTVGAERDAKGADIVPGDPNHAGGDGWLLPSLHGRCGRVVETLHLKLRMVAAALDVTYRTERATNQPMLNLSDASFRVDLGERSPGLPFMWGAHVTLAVGGDAFEVPVPGVAEKYYLPGRPSELSLYRPAIADQPPRGRAIVQAARHIPQANEQLILQGTFVTDDRLRVGPRDLVCVRLPLGDQRIELYLNLERSGQYEGEWRFRSLPQRFPDTVRQRIERAEGLPPVESAFEVLPLLGSPCDLYAVGVLAVRTLLVNGQNTLSSALEDVLTLARRAGAHADQSAPLSIRIAELFNTDPRWRDVLGPQRLIYDATTPQDASDAIPHELWLDVLAAIVRMFPGVSRDSACKDLGDCLASAVHRVFEPSMQEFERLLLRSRSLLAVDWHLNREISQVIRKQQMRFGSNQPAKPAAQAKLEPPRPDAAGKPALPAAPTRGALPAKPAPDRSRPASQTQAQPQNSPRIVPRQR